MFCLGFRICFPQKLTSWVFNDQPRECAVGGHSKTIGRAGKMGWKKGKERRRSKEEGGGKRSWRLPDPGLSPPPAQGRFAGRTQSCARTRPTRPLAGGPGVSPGSRKKRFHTTQTPLPTPRWILPADAPVDTTCWRPGGYYRLLHVRRLAAGCSGREEAWAGAE